MQELVEVVAINGNNLHIQTISNAVCSKCADSGGCKKNIFAWFKKPKYYIERPKDLDIEVKDKFIIAIDDHNINQAATAVYLVPLAAFMISLSITSMLALNEITQIITSLISLVLGIYLAKYYASKNTNSCKISIAKKVI